MPKVAAILLAFVALALVASACVAPGTPPFPDPARKSKPAR
jgi:hypothetical protein